MLDDSAITGAYRRSGSDEFGGPGQLYGRTVVAVYGSQSGYGTATLAFDLANGARPTRLAIVGMDDENTDNVVLRVELNGVPLFQGDSTFPDEAWGEMTFELPSSALRSGQNVLRIQNLELSANVGLPPWILIDRVELLP